MINCGYATCRSEQKCGRGDSQLPRATPQVSTPRRHRRRTRHRMQPA